MNNSAQESTDEPANTVITDVGNKVVPHQRAVTYATQQWLSRLQRHLEAFAARPSDGRHLAAMSFAIDDLGSLETSYVDSFDISTSLEADRAAVVVRYKCRGSVHLSRVPKSKEVYFRLREVLNRHGLKHKSAISSTIAKVQLEPVVPVEMVFSAKLKDAVIEATFKNVGALGTAQHQLSPHDSGIDLLNAIEDVILGDPTKFDSRSGQLVSRDERIRLSKQLSDKARENAAVAKEPVEASGIINKLKRAIGKH